MTSDVLEVLETNQWWGVQRVREERGNHQGQHHWKESLENEVKGVETLAGITKYTEFEGPGESCVMQTEGQNSLRKLK